jgi:uncharacterized protein (DUF1778 family)
MPKGGKREGAGRKPAPNSTVKTVSAKVSIDEYAAIQQAATDTGQTFSQWARQILVEATKK